MGKMLTIRSTDGVWNLPHTTSLSNGISGAKDKAADCPSRLVKLILTSTSVNMLTASSTDGPAFHTRSCTQHASSSATSTPHPDPSPLISQETNTTPKPLTVDHLDALLQMQRTDPFCKCRLLNGKAPHHEFDTFTHMKGLL